MAWNEDYQRLIRSIQHELKDQDISELFDKEYKIKFMECNLDGCKEKTLPLRDCYIRMHQFRSNPENHKTVMLQLYVAFDHHTNMPSKVVNFNSKETNASPFLTCILNNDNGGNPELHDLVCCEFDRNSPFIYVMDKKNQIKREPRDIEVSYEKNFIYDTVKFCFHKDNVKRHIGKKY